MMAAGVRHVTVDVAGAEVCGGGGSRGGGGRDDGGGSYRGACKQESVLPNV